MNYSIKFAKSGAQTIWLDKNGNKYIVSDFNTVSNTSTFREEFDRFDPAERRFYAICKTLNPCTIYDVEHDPAEFCFD